MYLNESNEIPHRVVVAMAEYVERNPNVDAKNLLIPAFTWKQYTLFNDGYKESLAKFHTETNVFTTTVSELINQIALNQTNPDIMSLKLPEVVTSEELLKALIYLNSTNNLPEYICDVAKLYNLEYYVKIVVYLSDTIDLLKICDRICEADINQKYNWHQVGDSYEHLVLRLVANVHHGEVPILSRIPYYAQDSEYMFLLGKYPRLLDMMNILYNSDFYTSEYESIGMVLHPPVELFLIMLLEEYYSIKLCDTVFTATMSYDSVKFRKLIRVLCSTGGEDINMYFKLGLTQDELDNILETLYLIVSHSDIMS